MASTRPDGWWPRVILMSLFTLWSGALAAGFGYAAVTGSDRLGAARAALFGLLAVLLGVVAARTAYELMRRLRET